MLADFSIIFFNFKHMRPPLYYGNILAYFGIIIHLEFAYTFLTQKSTVKKYVLLADKIKKQPQSAAVGFGLKLFN